MLTFHAAISASCSEINVTGLAVNASRCQNNINCTIPGGTSTNGNCQENAFLKWDDQESGFLQVMFSTAGQLQQIVRIKVWYCVESGTDIPQNVISIASFIPNGTSESAGVDVRYRTYTRNFTEPIAGALLTLAFNMKDFSLLGVNFYAKECGKYYTLLNKLRTLQCIAIVTVLLVLFTYTKILGSNNNI